MHPLPAWEIHLKRLQNIKEHIYTPGATTSGHRGAVHKAAVMVHQWHLDVPTEIRLQDYADSYAGMCLDLGTEESVPDFQCVGGVESLLPPWIHRGGLRTCAEPVAAAGGEGFPVENNQPRNFLPHAIKVYGFQHTVNNPILHNLVDICT